MTQEELLRLPKVELHCHLDGSLSQEFIEKRLGRSVKKRRIERIGGLYKPCRISGKV